MSLRSFLSRLFGRKPDPVSSPYEIVNTTTTAFIRSPRAHTCYYGAAGRDECVTSIISAGELAVVHETNIGDDRDVYCLPCALRLGLVRGGARP